MNRLFFYTVSLMFFNSASCFLQASSNSTNNHNSNISSKTDEINNTLMTLYISQKNSGVSEEDIFLPKVSEYEPTINRLPSSLKITPEKKSKKKGPISPAKKRSNPYF